MAAPGCCSTLSQLPVPKALPRLPPRPWINEESPSPSLSSKRDILGDVQCRYQVRVLVDGCNAEFLCVSRVEDAAFRVPDAQCPGVRPERARQDLEHRGSPCAVRPHEAVDFAYASLELAAA